MKTITEEMRIVLAEYRLIRPILVEGDPTIQALGDEIAKKLNIKFDGEWEDANLLQFTDTNKFVSNGHPATFYSKDIDSTIKKVIEKIKAFNPDDWKEKLSNWISSLTDTEMINKVQELTA